MSKILQIEHQNPFLLVGMDKIRLSVQSSTKIFQSVRIRIKRDAITPHFDRMMNCDVARAQNASLHELNVGKFSSIHVYVYLYRLSKGCGVERARVWSGARGVGQGTATAIALSVAAPRLRGHHCQDHGPRLRSECQPRHDRALCYRDWIV
ncbi:uncharacterized protein LOC113235491 [Hyposmocoma kahamanoa]|uniref:uncharacterized protein LOC113235491 n=1 Tax=Hyposmocoma kahamanoa TaxID=1477025 RepID=UPI000E6D6BF8|nr:uncharacterized protein LOC113235491 [Hyposmocoma kahamanoa]